MALREAARCDTRVPTVLEEGQRPTRRRPEIGDAINDVNLRFVAIFAELEKYGLYDRDWTRMKAPPFDIGYVDDRLDQIRGMGA